MSVCVCVCVCVWWGYFSAEMHSAYSMAPVDWAEGIRPKRMTEWVNSTH